jgi:hypothetical protein
MLAGYLTGWVLHSFRATLVVPVGNKAEDPDKGCPLVPWPTSGNVGVDLCGGLLSTSAGAY